MNSEQLNQTAEFNISFVVSLIAYQIVIQLLFTVTFQSNYTPRG